MGTGGKVAWTQSWPLTSAYFCLRLTSASPICLHGMQRNNFIFVLCCYLELYYSGTHNSKRNCYPCLQGSERARVKTSLTAHVLSIILLLLIMNTNAVVFRIYSVLYESNECETSVEFLLNKRHLMTQAVSVEQLGPGRLNCVGHTKSKKLVTLNHFKSCNK